MAHILFCKCPPACKVAQLRIESVHGAKGSECISHVAVCRDVVASQSRLSDLLCQHSQKNLILIILQLEHFMRVPNVRIYLVAILVTMVAPTWPLE